MSGEASRYYANLPGVQAYLVDGNYYSSSITQADAIVVLGTAQDGPLFRPSFLHRADSGTLTYGSVTSTAIYSLMKGVSQINGSGADNIVGCRITGQYAETILLESLTPTSISLDPITVSETNTTKRYSLTVSGVRQTWLSYVAIDSVLSDAVIMEEDAGGSPLAVPAEDWVEGQEYWINYREGYIEFCSPPIDNGLDTTSDNGTIAFDAEIWPHSIKLRSVYPGSRYNTSYSGNEDSASMLVTVSISGTTGTINITRPDGVGTGDLEVTFDTVSDTNQDVVNAINSLATNNIIQAYIVDTSYKSNINSIVANESAPYTDASVVKTTPTLQGTAPYTDDFFSTTVDEDAVAVTWTITDGTNRLWDTATTYRRFHYGADEETSIENIPGVTGLPAPVTNGDCAVTAVGTDITRHVTGGTGTTLDDTLAYLPYYYAYHATENFKQDIYNALLYKGTAYIECRPDSSGNYYDSSGDPANAYYAGLKATHGAFDWLEKIDISWIVPKNMWADTKVFAYSATSTYEENSFAELFAEFAASSWERGSFTMVSMAYSPIESTKLVDIETYVSNCINHAASLSFSTVSGITDSVIDSGRFLVLSAGPEVLVNISGMGKVHSTAECLVAATIASLEPGTSPTNFPLRGSLGLRYELTLNQMNDLVGSYLMCFQVNPLDRIVKIVDGTTMAADISSTQPSDYYRIRTMRIVKTAVNVVKLAGEPWIGKGNSREARMSLKTAISAALTKMVDNGSLRGYLFDISSTNSGYLADNLIIDLTLIPTGEIKKITIPVTVRR
jgi:hypothetical protein